ncbi:hypothetical protein RPPS3_40680 [Rhodopseudomonas palustris]|uniref:O-antigen ligase family protein n=1 Tax=Rhodopseudomonas palustris TaxID=1076 RepID=UPI000D1C0518|nr:O-antigen ligase family protein [Rhodopseudomonas palustris]AVT78130.1 hypothetical protein RPPS3_40680 [Rhodopseudomonas palustris]
MFFAERSPTAGTPVAASPVVKAGISQRRNYLLLATILAAPYFYIRPYGFDFSRGTSLSLVDIGLFALLISALTEQRANLVRQFGNCVYAKIGVTFVLVAMIAAALGRYLIQFETPLKWWNFLSVLSQYGFVLIALPWLAMYYLPLDLRKSIRWIALAYLPPMLLGLILVNHSSPDDLRSLFYSINRGIGTYGNANSFAVVILLVLPYYVYLSLTERGAWQILGYAGSAVSIVSLLLTVSFSSILTLSVMIAVVALFLMWRFGLRLREWRDVIRFVSLTGSLTLALALAICLYEPQVLTDLSPRFATAKAGLAGQGLEAIGSGSQRMELMEAALHIIGQQKGNLLWGNGLGNARFSELFTFGDVSLDVHNLYLLLWLEAGLAGMCLFASFLLAAIIFALRRATYWRAEAVTIGMSVFAMAVSAMSYPHLYLRYFWIPLLPAFLLARKPNTADAAHS